MKGLGEQLVSGEITPSSYLLDKNTLKIVKKQEKFKLNPKFLESIANAGKKIESHYKSPQDVEWAIDKKGNLFILQSRAITTI